LPNGIASGSGLSDSQLVVATRSKYDFALRLQFDNLAQEQTKKIRIRQPQMSVNLLEDHLTCR
jgi:hypothetical protein